MSMIWLLPVLTLGMMTGFTVFEWRHTNDPRRGLQATLRVIGEVSVAVATSHRRPSVDQLMVAHNRDELPPR